MYRRRRYYRRSGRRARYSSENYANTGTFELNGEDPGPEASPDIYDPDGFKRSDIAFFPSLVFVGQSSVQGIRKVKNFDINITPILSFDDGQEIHVIDGYKLAWAIVYVPEGTSTSPILKSVNGSFYEPNQNVIACGMADPTQNNRFRTKLARNLGSGDKIVLVCQAIAPGNIGNNVVAKLIFSCSYAITYN